MDSQSDFDLTLNREEQNTLTLRKHRKELWWQILIPFFFLFFLVIGGVYLILSGDLVSVEKLSQVGTMIILLPIILITIVLFILVFALIIGIAKLLKWIPPKAFRLQNQILRFNNRAKQAADYAAEPVLQIDSWVQAVKKSFERYF